MLEKGEGGGLYPDNEVFLLNIAGLNNPRAPCALGQGGGENPPEGLGQSPTPASPSLYLEAALTRPEHLPVLQVHCSFWVIFCTIFSLNLFHVYICSGAYHHAITA